MAGLAGITAVALGVVLGWFIFDEIRVRREIRDLERKYPGLRGVRP